MEQTKLTWEQVKELIPEKVTLTYVSYDDDLDDHTDKIQDCLSNNNWEALDMLVDEAFDENRWHNVKQEMKDLRKELQSKYDLKKREAKALIEEYEDDIRDTLGDRDDSNPLKELISHTSGLIAHYDTGYYMESESWSWPQARVRLERYAIKKHLGIVATNDYDDAMDMMIRQASYGGQLLIFFKLDLDDFLGEHSNRNTIKFKNFMFGIVDHHNGSGDVMDRPIKEEISLPYNSQNIFLEKSIKYNWSYSIAGMCSDWADSTEVSFSEEESGEIEKSKTNAHLNQEHYYNGIFKAGGCTFGDMDITRHRRKEYINNFPCGNTCKDCGTFWID